MRITEDMLDTCLLDLGRNHVIRDGFARHADEDDRSARAQAPEDTGRGTPVA